MAAKDIVSRFIMASQLVVRLSKLGYYKATASICAHAGQRADAKLANFSILFCFKREQTNALWRERDLFFNFNQRGTCD